jgi:hypothetical protein
MSYSQRVGVLGINLEKLGASAGSDALRISGNNLGSMMFTQSIYNQVVGSEYLSYRFDAGFVNENLDAVVIPAANWINHRSD